VTRPEPGGPVVVDTSVFGADLLKVRAPLAASYQPFLVGRAVFISFVTVAELRYGARRADWGDPRLR
jgi:predicted nucleic acid-binding protein